jgi:hypothetical protein
MKSEKRAAVRERIKDKRQLPVVGGKYMHTYTVIGKR